MKDLKKKQSLINVFSQTSLFQDVFDNIFSTLVGILAFGTILGTFILGIYKPRILEVIIFIAIGLGALYLLFLVGEEIRCLVIASKISKANNELENFASFDDLSDHLREISLEMKSLKLNDDTYRNIFVDFAKVCIYNYLISNEKILRQNEYFDELFNETGTYHNDKYNIDKDYNLVRYFAFRCATNLTFRNFDYNIEDFFEDEEFKWVPRKFILKDFLDYAKVNENLNPLSLPKKREIFENCFFILLIAIIMIAIASLPIMTLFGYVLNSIVPLGAANNWDISITYLLSGFLLTIIGFVIYFVILAISEPICFAKIAQYLPLSNKEFKDNAIFSYEDFENYTIAMFKKRNKLFSHKHVDFTSNITEEIFKTNVVKSVNAYIEYSKSQCLNDKILSIIDNDNIDLEDFIDLRVDNMFYTLYNKRNIDNAFETIYYNKEDLQ